MFTIPDRVNNSMTGSQFGSSITNNVGESREAAILQQLELGNVPNFMRTAVDISLVSGAHGVVVSVLPDYYCIGTDDDFLRMPMFPATAQRIADAFDASLPTRKLVDAIWRAATIQVSPHPLPPNAAMASTGAFVDHNRIIELQRAGRGGLIAGHKKDIVITPKLTDALHRVCIYGWHELSGTPIQGLNPVSHSDTYEDYSHGVRLVSRDVLLDGKPARLEDLLRDPVLSSLVSDEGPSTFLGYPTA
jgi:hypothetical protein